MKFCSDCGNQLNDKAVVCTHCGVAIEDRPTFNNQRSKWLLSMPIVGTVLGALGFLVSLDDSPYSEMPFDTDMAWAGILLLSAPAIILGAISVNKNVYKNMGIVSLVLGSVALISYMVILNRLIT